MERLVMMAVLILVGAAILLTLFHRQRERIAREELRRAIRRSLQS